ncbi:group 1 glycosyl transferase [Mycolicibacterium austroafricanum]|nr:group 1 glycosyl transferase [Mycolicibacterium austroafricanum]
MMKMCSAFAQNGHSVALWGLRSKKDAFTRSGSIFRIYGVQPNFSMFRLMHIRGAYWLYVLRAVLGARRWKPDIIYCRCVFSARFATRLRLPVYFEAHHPFDGNKDMEAAFRDLIASPHLRRIVFITRALENFYKSTYPEISCETLVSPDGADPMPQELASPVPTRARVQVGYVGQLHPGKGMEIISLLAARCSWADFLVVGGEERAIVDWKNKCRNISNITFKGFVSHREVYRYIVGFDVVLLPNQRVVGVAGNRSLNISDWTSPLKAFEYMAAGKAIISSDLPVLREVLEDGVNALLCDPEDVEQWRQALIQLSKEPELRRMLGANAQRDFSAHYSWSARARSIITPSGADGSSVSESSLG